MKRIGSNKVVADGRCTFMLRCEPRLLINAFAEARKEGVPFPDWFEAALRNQLPGIRRAESSRPDMNRIERFCDLAETKPEQLRGPLQRAYRAVTGDAWETYWVAPRVSVEQIENGALAEAEQRPRLNRRRVADDWACLVGRERATAATSNDGDCDVRLADTAG